MHATFFLATSALMIAASAIPVVPNLNATAYLGRWYQMYEDLSDEVFELGSLCDTADYGLFANGSISVLNSNRYGKPNGVGHTISGYATIPDPKVVAKLVVHLDGVPAPAPYWVTQIGPQTFVGDECPNPPCYQYAVVTDPLEVSLFVLARNPANFYAEFNTTVFNTLIAQGFTKSYNAPKALYQKSDCVYMPKPSAGSEAQ